MSKTAMPTSVTAFLLCLWASTILSPGGTAEIKGRITNSFTEEQYRAVTIVITDRLGVEIGRTKANKSGRFQVKISGPRYIILKAILEGYPTKLYQLDTEEYSESTDDREENRAFGRMRILNYYQDITFDESGVSDSTSGADLLTLEELTGEDPRAVKDYERARKKKGSGDLQGAVRDLEKLIKKYPEFYLGYIDLGLILLAQQENNRAFDVFVRARVLRPEQSLAYVGLGMALNNNEDYAAAAGYLEKAVELEPNSVNALFQLGHALFKLGDSERALVRFRRVTELAPGFHPLAYKTMASIYVSKQDPAGAAQALEEYLAFFPDAADREKVKQILAKLKASQ